MNPTTTRAPGAGDTTDERTALEIARELIAAGAGADAEALIEAHLLVLCGVVCATADTAAEADAMACRTAASLVGTVRRLVQRPAGESVQ
jgi:hypothetical protein